jgi:hypothetical protein
MQVGDTIRNSFQKTARAMPYPKTESFPAGSPSGNHLAQHVEEKADQNVQVFLGVTKSDLRRERSVEARLGAIW